MKIAVDNCRTCVIGPDVLVAKSVKCMRQSLCSMQSGTVLLSQRSVQPLDGNAVAQAPDSLPPHWITYKRDNIRRREYGNRRSA